MTTAANIAAREEAIAAEVRAGAPLGTAMHDARLAGDGEQPPAR